MGSPPAGRSLVLWAGHSVFAVQRAPQWTDPAYYWGPQAWMGVPRTGVLQLSEEKGISP